MCPNSFLLFNQSCILLWISNPKLNLVVVLVLIRNICIGQHYRGQHGWLADTQHMRNQEGNLSLMFRSTGSVLLGVSENESRLLDSGVMLKVVNPMICTLGWALFGKFWTIKKLFKPLKDIYPWITKLVSKWL